MSLTWAAPTFSAYCAQALSVCLQKGNALVQQRGAIAARKHVLCGRPQRTSHASQRRGRRSRSRRNRRNQTARAPSPAPATQPSPTQPVSPATPATQPPPAREASPNSPSTPSTHAPSSFRLSPTAEEFTPNASVERNCTSTLSLHSNLQVQLDRTGNRIITRSYSRETNLTIAVAPSDATVQADQRQSLTNSNNDVEPTEIQRSEDADTQAGTPSTQESGFETKITVEVDPISNEANQSLMSSPYSLLFEDEMEEPDTESWPSHAPGCLGYICTCDGC